MTAAPVVDLWWADLTAADLALLEHLPAAEARRVRAIAPAADQGRSLVAAALLQHAVAAQRRGQATSAPGFPPAPGSPPVEVDRTCAECGAQHGRPVVEGGPHLSIAHAGLLVVVATCASAPIGVDVERLDRELADGTRIDATAWTRAEALTKAGASPGGSHHVLPLTPPLPGYAATLALAPDLALDPTSPTTPPTASGGEAPQIREHRWPPG